MKIIDPQPGFEFRRSRTCSKDNPAQRKSSLKLNPQMDLTKENDDKQITFELADEDESAEDSVSVDEFIRELEAKEKDLHITSETTFIELESEFDEGEVPDFIKEELDKTVIERAGKVDTKGNTADREAIRKFEAEVKSLRSKVSGLEEERVELQKNSQRRTRDFEAYKARTERERLETFEKLLCNLATEMLPVLDNLERALQFAADKNDTEKGEISQFFQGIVLVNQQVNEVLAGMGIVPIATVGEVFDPHFHEAVAVDTDGDLPPNTVTAELLKGFRIGGRVIRHSMVKVSKAAEPPKPVETEEAEPSETEPPAEATTADQDEAVDTAGQETYETSEPESTEAKADNAEATDAADVPPDDSETEETGFEIERNGETEMIEGGKV